MSTVSPSLSAADVPLELNPKLDVAALKHAFARAGRVQIREVLTASSALALLRVLQEETPWTATMNEGAEAREFPNITPEERGRLAIGAYQRARAQFQYIYDKHSLTFEGEPYGDGTHYFARLVAFLNGPQFLALIREVTSIEAIAWTDAQATLYRPGDFLITHDDAKSGSKRRAAYVLNMTPSWRADWGGILQFADERGQIAQGYVPAFNVLNLFRVPVMHGVSQVTFFGGNRYSVTGWFHSR